MHILASPTFVVQFQTIVSFSFLLLLLLFVLVSVGNSQVASVLFRRIMISTADSTGTVYHFPRSRLKVHRAHQQLKSTLTFQNKQEHKVANVIEPVFILKLRKAPIAYNTKLISQWTTTTTATTAMTTTTATTTTTVDAETPMQVTNTSNASTKSAQCHHPPIPYILTNIKVEWPGLYVYPSLIPESGLGVFTCIPLKKGTTIPYLGCLQHIDEMEHPMYSMWAGASVIWNAAPELNPLRNFISSTNFGPFLASRINQSNVARGFPANLTIQQGKQLKNDAVFCKSDAVETHPFQMNLVATQNIPAGAELLARYNRSGC